MAVIEIIFSYSYYPLSLELTVYRTLAVFTMLVSIALAGCQESDPSRTIVSMQLDSDEENIWVYLYTTPRVKMGNLTISINNNPNTLTSVFSHQLNLSFENASNFENDRGFVEMEVSADLKGVYWIFSWEMKVYRSSEAGADNFESEVLISDEVDENSFVWSLPHNIALEYVT